MFRLKFNPLKFNPQLDLLLGIAAVLVLGGPRVQVRVADVTVHPGYDTYDDLVFWGCVGVFVVGGLALVLFHET